MLEARVGAPSTGACADQNDRSALGQAPERYVAFAQWAHQVGEAEVGPKWAVRSLVIWERT